MTFFLVCYLCWYPQDRDAETLRCHLLIVAGPELILTLIKSVLEGFSSETYHGYKEMLKGCTNMPRDTEKSHK